MKKWIKNLLIIVIVVVLLLGSFIILGRYRTNKAFKEKYDVSPSLADAEVKDMGLYISAGGNIQSYEEAKIYTSAYGEITEQNVLVGQKVSAGEVLAVIDATKLQEDIETLENDIFYKELEIEKSVFQDDVYYIKAPISGEVKDIKVREDDSDTENVDEASDISEVMDEYGYIALISPDDLMYIVTDDTAEYLTLGAEVTVSRYDLEYDGVVEKIEDGYTYILINNDNISIGGRVSIYADGYSGKIQGTAQLYAWTEVDVPTSEGRISQIYVYNNKYVEQGDKLFKVTARSQEMVDMYNELHDLREELAEKQAMLLNLEVTSPVDGIITSVSIEEGQEAEDEYLAYTIADTSVWIVKVSVDELDINTIMPGMSAEVSVDAYDEGTFSGTVTSISALGEASNGVTSYEVGIEVENNDVFKLNMTANAEIEVSFITDALTVPVEAVRTIDEKNYVVIYTNPTEKQTEEIKAELIAQEKASLLQSDDDSSMTTDEVYDNLTITDKIYGQAVEVEVGLINETYAQILSGLSEGDTVILPDDSSDSEDITYSPFSGMRSSSD